MDYFESLIRVLLEQKGYWTRQSFKVDLSKEEERATGKPSIPRPEIDIVAYNPKKNELLILEVKSYLDSLGVQIKHLEEKHEVATGSYKLFTCENYRNIVQRRLVEQLEDEGLVFSGASLNLGLAAGRIYQNNTLAMQKLFDLKGWRLWTPEDISADLRNIAKSGYANDPFIMSAKVLQRSAGS